MPIQLSLGRPLDPRADGAGISVPGRVRTPERSSPLWARSSRCHLAMNRGTSSSHAQSRSDTAESVLALLPASTTTVCRSNGRPRMGDHRVASVLQFILQRLGNDPATLLCYSMGARQRQCTGQMLGLSCWRPPQKHYHRKLRPVSMMTPRLAFHQTNHVRARLRPSADLVTTNRSQERAN
jgi:hypothetical protein